jgi:Rrf2 family protein
MKLTSRGELGLKAMLELARAAGNGEQALSASELSLRCHASITFLEQVLSDLRQGGFVVSTRGRFGGHRLARSPDEIHLGEINRYLDGPLAPAPCASLSQHQPCEWCLSEAECDLKPIWIEVRDAIAAVMDNLSLSDVLARSGRRLSARYAI